MKKSSSRIIATLAIMAAVIIVANFLDKAYSFGLVALGGEALAVCALTAVVTFSASHNKFYYAIFAGVMFGLVSFILAYIFPSPLMQNPLVSWLPRCFVGIIGFGVYKLAQLLSKGLLALVKRFNLGITIPIVLLTADVSGAICFMALGGTKGWVFFLCLVAFVLGGLLSAGLLLAVETARSANTERKLEHFSLSMGAMFTVVANTALVLPMMLAVSLWIMPGKYGTLADVYAILTIVNFLPELIITTLVAPVVVLGVRRGLKLGVDGNPRKKQIIDNAQSVTETTGEGEN